MDHTSRLLGSLGLGSARNASLLGRPRRDPRLYGASLGAACPTCQQVDPNCVDPTGINCSCVPIPGCTDGGVNINIDPSWVCRAIGWCSTGSARPPAGYVPPAGSVPWYSTGWGTALLALGGAAVVGGGIYLAVR